MARELVTLKWEDLLAGKDLSEDVFRAYGPDGLGALTISGIPGYVEQREALLPLSHRVAHLSDEAKASLEHEASMYNVGWSHGKEKLGDKPDVAKGSYYANPLYDEAGDADMVAKYPYFYPKNIWPDEHCPELEGAFKTLGKTMFDAVVKLAEQIDELSAARVAGYKKGTLSEQMVTTRKIKGRLLYYYPTDETDSQDGWIGWHNDSGFLTALTSAMFFDDDTATAIPNPDPEGGLWIVDRTGGTVRVRIPPDHLAIQCGECLQIITGGLLVATPHAVRASKAPAGVRIGRGTFPVFIDTNMDFPLSAPEGCSREQVFDRTMDSRVPPLQDRWRGGESFVEFLGTTFQHYYEWSKK